jgi:uncharacterized membrane protein YhaH (DUF805 family)
LSQLFSFSGYTGRLGYLGATVAQAALIVVGFGMLVGFSPKGGEGGSLPGALIGLGVACLASTWVWMAATCRRLRDMGWPVVPGLLGAMFLPFFSLLLFCWPSADASRPDTAVFSDEPEPKKRKAKDADAGPSWMQNALSQVSTAKSAPATVHRPAPIVQPRISGALTAAAGARTEFGLRR